jgi:hypothetical protein
MEKSRRLERARSAPATRASGVSVLLALLGLLALAVGQRSWLVEAASTTAKITSTGFTCAGQPCPALTLSVGDSVVYVNETGMTVTFSVVNGSPTSTSLAPQGTLTYTAGTPTSDGQATAHSVVPPLLVTQSLVVNPLNTPAPTSNPTPTPTTSTQTSSSTTTPSSTPGVGPPGASGGGSGGQVPDTHSGAPSGVAPIGKAIALAPPGGTDLSCVPLCPSVGGSTGGHSFWWALLPLALAVALVAIVYVRYRRASDHDQGPDGFLGALRRL